LLLSVLGVAVYSLIKFRMISYLHIISERCFNTQNNSIVRVLGLFRRLQTSKRGRGLICEAREKFNDTARHKHTQ